MHKVAFGDNYTGQVRRILLHLLAWGLFVGISAFVSGKTFLIPGLATGWTSSVVYFLLMCHRVKKSAALPPEKAVAAMRTGWLLRYGFMIAMLVLSIRVPGIDFWAAVAGLFSLHIVLFLHAVSIVVAGVITNLGKTKINS